MTRLDPVTAAGDRLRELASLLREAADLSFDITPDGIDEIARELEAIGALLAPVRRQRLRRHLTLLHGGLTDG